MKSLIKSLLFLLFINTSIGVIGQFNFKEGLIVTSENDTVNDTKNSTDNAQQISQPNPWTFNS